MTGSGMLVIALGYILNYLGVNADSSDLAGYADGILKVAGLIMLLWGQLRRKDLTWGLFRK